MQEEEIIKGVLAGGRQQEQALRALYTKAAEWRRYFVYRKGVSQDVAEDVVQDAICKIFRSASSFSGGQGFGDASANSWMWQVARSCLIDEIRKKKPTGVSLDQDDDADLISANQVHMEAEVAISASKSHSRDAEQCVSDGLEDFAADYPDRARALEMQMDGEDMPSIANRIGRTVGATKEFLSQSKKKLAPYIEHCLPLLAA